MPERIGKRGPVHHVVGKGLAAAFRKLGLALFEGHCFLLGLMTTCVVVDRALYPASTRAVRQHHCDSYDPQSAHAFLLFVRDVFDDLSTASRPVEQGYEDTYRV